MLRKKINVEMDFINQVQIELFQRGKKYRLGPSEIGFEGLRINCSSEDSNSSCVYLNGFSDNLTYFDLYKRYAKPGTIALDVGGNLGIHTIAMSRCVGSLGEVHSFEALKPVYERHTENLALNSISNVTAHNVAVGAQAGKVNFNDNVSDFNIGKGRIAESGNISVEMVPLDDVLANSTHRISLMKLDIEGHELNALKGTQQILLKNRPVIVCEFNPGEYSLQAYMEYVPYKCKLYRVPLTYYENLESMPEDTNSICDVAIIPVYQQEYG